MATYELDGKKVSEREFKEKVYGKDSSQAKKAREKEANAPKAGEKGSGKAVVTKRDKSTIVVDTNTNEVLSETTPEGKQRVRVNVDSKGAVGKPKDLESVAKQNRALREKARLQEDSLKPGREEQLQSKQEVLTSEERPEVLERLRSKQSNESPEVLKRIREKDIQERFPSMITAQEKPKGIINKAKNFLEKEEGKAILSEQRRSGAGKTSFKEGAILFGVGVAKGAIGTVELFVKPKQTIVSLYNFGKSAVKNPKIISDVARELGQSFARNPAGFAGEIVGSAGVFKGASVITKASGKFVKASTEASKLSKKYAGAIVERPKGFLEDIPKDVSVEGTPVVGARYSGTREQLQGFVREESVLVPEFGKPVNLRQLDEVKAVKAKATIQQEVTEIVASNKEGLIKKPLDVKISKTKERIVPVEDVPTRNTFSSSLIKDNGDLGVKIKESGIVSYESIVAPSKEAKSAFKLLSDNSKNQLVSLSKKNDVVAKQFFAEDVGVVDITVKGQRRTVLFDTKSFEPLAEVRRGSSVSKIVRAKPDINRIVKSSFGESGGATIATVNVDVGGGQVGVQAQKVKQETVSALSTPSSSGAKQTLASKEKVSSEGSKASESVVGVRPKPVVAQDSVKKPITSFSTGKSSVKSSRFALAQGSKDKLDIGQVNKQFADISQVNKLGQGQSNAQSQSNIQNQANTALQAQAKSLAQSQKLELLQNKIVSSEQLRRNKVFQKPAVRPRFPFNTKKNKLNEGYDVFVRERGEFKKISGSSLKKSDALDLGAFYVSNTPRATFKLVSGGRVGAGVSDKVKGSFKRFGSNLKLKGGLFIEKREKRIKSAGEKAGITLKGIQSLKSKGRRSIL